MSTKKGTLPCGIQTASRSLKIMDFFAMEPERYQRYIHATNAFIKENGITHEGVLHNVIEGFPVIFDRLATCQALKGEEVEAVLQAYSREDAVFSVRFARIFERCIGDPVLHSDMEFWLGGVHTWAKAVTTVPEAAFERIWHATEGLGYTPACRAFDEIIRTEHETLSGLVDRCYDALYK